MLKKIVQIAFTILLVVSLGLNIFFVFEKNRAENYSVQGTYATGDNENGYEFLVLQEDNNYCIYTQEKGVTEKGSYSRENETILLKTAEQTKEAVCKRDTVYLADGENILTYSKNSNLELFVNINE